MAFQGCVCDGKFEHGDEKYLLPALITCPNIEKIGEKEQRSKQG